MAEAQIFTGTIKEIGDGVEKRDGHEYSYIRFDDHPPIYNVSVPKGMKQPLFRTCESGKESEFYFLHLRSIKAIDDQRKDVVLLLAFSTGPSEAFCISAEGNVDVGTAGMLSWLLILIFVGVGLIACVTIVGIPIGLALFRMANLTQRQNSMSQIITPIIERTVGSFRQKYPNALFVGRAR